MTRARATLLSLLILVIAGPAGAADMQPTAAAAQPPEADAQAPAEARSPLASLYSPLEDPQAGRLYPVAADLLNAARGLPDKIDLERFIRPAAKAPAAAPAEPGAGQSAAPAPAPVQAAGQTWQRVSEQPVVDEEDLAFAYYQAGLYAQAADAYRRLAARTPPEAHFLVMLMLSERNRGNDQEAAKLRAELKNLDAARPWAEWIEHMQNLAGSPAEEGK